MGKYVRTELHRKALSERAKKQHLSGEQSSNWKGDKVGYSGIHIWMRTHYGTPRLCDKCGTTDAGRFDWANISGQYKRDRSDWTRLCRGCHMRQDGRGARAVKAMHARFIEKVIPDANWLIGG